MSSSWAQPVGGTSGRLEDRGPDRPGELLLLLHHASPPPPSQVHRGSGFRQWTQFLGSNTSASSLCLQPWVVVMGEGSASCYDNLLVVSLSRLDVLVLPCPL